MKRLPEDRIILQAQKAEEKREGSLRRTTALMRKTTSEKNLATQRQAERENLLAARHARHARLLSERELRRERVRPYYEAAKQVVSVPWKALKAVGAASERYAQAHPQPQVRTYPHTVTRSQAPQRAPAKSLDISVDIGKIELL